MTFFQIIIFGDTVNSVSRLHILYKIQRCLIALQTRAASHLYCLNTAIKIFFCKKVQSWKEQRKYFCINKVTERRSGLYFPTFLLSDIYFSSLQQQQYDLPFFPSYCRLTRVNPVLLIMVLVIIFFHSLALSLGLPSLFTLKGIVH